MDKSKCPWIVGYYSKTTTDENLKGTVDRNLLSTFYNYSIDSPIEKWEFYNYIEEDFVTEPSNIVWQFYAQDIQQGRGGHIDIKHPGEYLSYSIVNTDSSISFGNLSINLYTGPRLTEQVKNNAQTLKNQLPDFVSYSNNQTLQSLLSYKDSIVKDSTGRYFKVTITSSDVLNKTTEITSGSLFETMTKVVNGVANASGTPNSQSFKVATTHSTYRVSIKELAYLESTWDMTGDKIVTEDTPYNIFAIPYGPIELLQNKQSVVISNSSDSIAAANSIIRKMSETLYDIQLLPYCPLVLDEEGIIEVKSNLEYSLITIPGETPEAKRLPVSFILNIPSARFTKNIYLDNPIIISNPKIENECDMYKLCSPNWASEYQFSAAKNNGVQYFNIDCEYKPFMPYIHLNPNFDGLYGQDFNDARGLILNGEFSLSQISDKWEEYQIQNKNFQNIFDRQIQNMEVQHKVGRIQELAGLGAGTVSGAATTTLAGSALFPGSASSLYGFGVAGALLSAAGGIADYALSEQLRSEAIDYTKDLFGYQLRNIQALPYTLTKVSSFNNNNKIFPILEHYSCTETEREALANKIAYNGMSVGVIGKISDYMENDWSYKDIQSKGYIKGQLIRLETVEDDFHIINAIADEMNKGVYIK